MSNGCYLITGGGSGTGREVSRLLKEQGFETVIWGTNEEKLKQSIEDQVANAYDVVDVGDAQQVARGFEKIRQSQTLVGVVHAAGIYTQGKLIDLDPQTIEKHIRVVTNGSTWVAREAVKEFIGKEGKVVIIAAASAKDGFEDSALNTLAKRAIDGLNEALAREIINENIKLTTVYPDSIGPADSDDVKNGQAMSYHDVATAILFALNASPTMQVRELILTAKKTSR